MTYLTSLEELLIAFHPRATTSATLNGDVVEIQGAACTGKSQLCYFFAMTTALSAHWQVELSTPHRPARTDQVELGGKNRAVVYFDTDGKFDVKRLAQMVENHLRRRVKEYCVSQISASVSGTDEEGFSKLFPTSMAGMQATKK